LSIYNIKLGQSPKFSGRDSEVSFEVRERSLIFSPGIEKGKSEKSEQQKS
jgi:hypothetical protein